MNTKKKVSKFVSSVNPNASVCIGSSSAYSKIRINLNETVRPGTSNPLAVKKPNLLSKKALEDENSKLQLTFAYNEYLQSLMKQMIIEKRIKKNEEILNGQIQYYGELLSDKQKQLDAIIADTNSLDKQKQIVETLKYFEESISRMKRLYQGHQINEHLEKLKEMLHTESQKLFLKNVKPIRTQEDFDKLMEVIETLSSTTEKFVNSGRDFDMVHKYAGEIRAFFENREKCHAACSEMLQVEKQAITGLIANLSEMFSKKYEQTSSDDVQNM